MNTSALIGVLSGAQLLNPIYAVITGNMAGLHEQLPENIDHYIMSVLLWLGARLLKHLNNTILVHCSLFAFHWSIDHSIIRV